MLQLISGHVEGGYIILIKMVVIQLLIKKMLRVVEKIIIQGYLENVD